MDTSDIEYEKLAPKL